MANDKIRHKNLGGTFWKQNLRKLSNHAYDTKSIFDCIRLMVRRNHTIL